MAFSSGLGSLTVASFLIETGQHALCCDDVYGGTHRFFSKCFPKTGKSATFVDGTTVESWTNKFQVGKTKMLWIESPTNPTMKMMDIRAIATAIKKLDPECIIIVDNTFMSPIFQSPLLLGADIVMHSCTKFINGHSDVIMGALMTNNQEIYSSLRFHQNALGIVPSAFDCYLVIRSIKTLQVRIKQQAENAMKLAKFLETHEHVERVLYPGLPSHPQHALATRECSGYGSMLSFCVKKTDGLDGIRVVDGVRVIKCAVSLGCVESLIQIPSLMTHTAIDEYKRLALGMDDNLLRVSVGLEDIDDLIFDIDQALNKAYSKKNQL